MSQTKEASVTIINDEISLVVQEMDLELDFQNMVQKLENDLTDNYLLDAKLISSSDSGSDMGESIVLTLSPEGLFQMNGRVRFETAKTTLTSLAEAKFGKGFVNNKLKLMPQQHKTGVS